MRIISSYKRIKTYIKYEQLFNILSCAKEDKKKV